MSLSKNRIIAITLSLLISGNASAGCWWQACQGLIEQINVAADDAWVAMEGDENALDCTPVAGEWMRLNAEHPNYESIIATLFAASLHNKTIRVRPYDGYGECEIQYVRLYVSE
jgi:hypothetical protein